MRLRAAGCVFAEEEAELLLAEAHDTGHLEEMTAQRASGRPLEHILGWVGFRTGRVVVGDHVFVPRQRTGLLVDVALERIREDAVVVELCCGAAAISTALLREAPLEVQLWASDIDPAAVADARKNLSPLGGHVVLGDLFDGLPPSLSGSVELLIANAPYVPTAAIMTMPPEAREHEAAIALDGGNDGLDLQRRIIAEASHWLSPTGAVVIETSQHQAPQTAALMRGAGLSPRVVRDEALDATAVLGLAG